MNRSVKFWSTILLLFGYVLYTFLFYHISAPFSNPYFGSFHYPHDSFWLGMAVLFVLLIQSIYIQIKFKDNQSTYMYCRTSSLWMISIPFSSLIFMSLIEMSSFGSGNMGGNSIVFDPWVKVSVASMFSLVTKTYYNWKIVKIENFYERDIKILSGAVHRSLLLGFIGLFAANTLITISLHTLKPFNVWIMRTILGIYSIFKGSIYLRSYLIRKNAKLNIESRRFLRKIDPAMATTSYLIIIYFVIMFPISGQYIEEGSALRIHFILTMTSFSVIALPPFISYFIKFIVLKVYKKENTIVDEFMKEIGLIPYEVEDFLPIYFIWYVKSEIKKIPLNLARSKKRRTHYG